MANLAFMRRHLFVSLVCVVAPALIVAPTALAQRSIVFRVADDGVVSANLYGDGTRAVVLVHGGRFDKWSWEPQARVLREAGFRVLALDLRGRGESVGGSAGSDALYLDVLGAVRYLRHTGATSIALIGASLGGWAVAEALTRAEPGEVDRVVLLAHSPIDTPERLVGNKLFIVSRGDTTGSGVPRLNAIRAQYEAAPEPKRLVVLEGSAHAQFLFQTDGAHGLMRVILEFLSAL